MNGLQKVNETALRSRTSGRSCPVHTAEGDLNFSILRKADVSAVASHGVSNGASKTDVTGCIGHRCVVHGSAERSNGGLRYVIRGLANRVTYSEVDETIPQAWFTTAQSSFFI